MAKHSISINFQPVANIALPVQVRFQIIADDQTTVVGEKLQMVTTPNEIFVNLGVFEVPGDPANITIHAATQDSGGRWNEQIVQPGSGISPLSVISFNGYQIGVK